MLFEACCSHLPKKVSSNNSCIRYTEFCFCSRLILRCRQEARIKFAKMRSDVLVKMELLDQKHGGYWSTTYAAVYLSVTNLCEIVYMSKDFIMMQPCSKPQVIAKYISVNIIRNCIFRLFFVFSQFKILRFLNINVIGS